MKRAKQLLFLKQNSSFFLPEDEERGEWRRPGVCGVLGGGSELVWAQGPGGGARTEATLEKPRISAAPPSLWVCSGGAGWGDTQP